MSGRQKRHKPFMGKELTMKRNWLKHIVVVISLVAGSIGNSAFAGNKGGSNFGGAVHNFQSGGQTNVVRSLNNTQTFQPQIKTLNGNNFQLQSRQHSPILNVPQLNNGIQGIQ